MLEIFEAQMAFANKMSLVGIALSPTPRVGTRVLRAMLRTGARQFIVIAVLSMPFTVKGSCQESNQASNAKEADRALREGEYDRAIALYKKVLQAEPSSAAAWNNLGTAWFAMDKVSPASDSFLHATRLQPANRDYSFNAGLALVREDRCEVAQRYLRLSLPSVQHRAVALYLLGLCAFASKQWSKSEYALLKAEAAGSRTAETYYMLTIAARKSLDPNEARRAFGLLQSKFPRSSLLHELIGEASDQNYMTAEAQKELSLAIANSPDAPNLHAELGFLLWKEHRLGDAERLFQQELVIDPHSYSAMRFLGDIAEKQNQLPQALAWYESALREQPKSGEGHFALGRVLVLQGRSEEALRELRACFPALEKDPSAHYWTANVLKKLGMRKEANIELLKVQEINKAERSAVLSKFGDSEH